MPTITEPRIHRFLAMACPCEVLLDTPDERLASELFSLAETEARRIEIKFSRYLPGNIIHQINRASGRPVALDDETAQLIDFADDGYRLSDGLFDISTGVLRRAWRFDQTATFPEDKVIQQARARVGWNRVQWRKPILTLLPDMEIDLGGIAKEYAVDRTLGLLRQRTSIAMLVNFGGDIATCGPRDNGDPWRVGIENVHREGAATHLIQMIQGGLATSGDSKKYILHQGNRFSHILNPLTGYPVKNAPRSVTVAADTCTQAGFLSTLAMLQGPEAEAFLQRSGIRSWCFRDARSPIIV